MLNQYTVPDKSTGQTWTSGEHNILKLIVNEAVAQTNTNTTSAQQAAADVAAINARLNPNPEW